jgi:hypothetical protein
VAGLRVPLLFSPSFSFSSGKRWRGQGRISPKAARVRIPPGLWWQLLIDEARCGGMWTAEMQRGSRGASRRRPCAAWPFFGAGISKRGKRDDDDSDIIVTHGGPH